MADWEYGPGRAPPRWPRRPLLFPRVCGKPVPVERAVRHFSQCSEECRAIHKREYHRKKCAAYRASHLRFAAKACARWREKQKSRERATGT